MGAGLSNLGAGCFGSDALLLALSQHDDEVVRQLLETEPKASTRTLSVRDCTNALQIAAADGRVDYLELVHKAVALHYETVKPKNAQRFIRRYLNRRNNYGQTALMLACKFGHADCVRWLLQKGADPMLFDSIHSRACLHYCALYGQSNCIDALFADNLQVDTVEGRCSLRQAHIVDSQGFHRFIDVRAAMGFAPIHMAASQGHWESVAALLSHGASLAVRCYGVLRADFTVPARWKPNSTPLHIAAARGSTSMVKCMLQSFAEQAMRDPALVDVRLMRDFSGQRPVDVARSFGYQRLAAMLDPAQPIELLSYVTRGRNTRLGPLPLATLACHVLRDKLISELDSLEKDLAPSRIQRQPSAAVLARRLSAAGLRPEPGEPGHGASSEGASLAVQQVPGLHGLVLPAPFPTPGSPALSSPQAAKPATPKQKDVGPSNVLRSSTAQADVSGFAVAASSATAAQTQAQAVASTAAPSVTVSPFAAAAERQFSASLTPAASAVFDVQGEPVPALPSLQRNSMLHVSVRFADQAATDASERPLVWPDLQQRADSGFRPSRSARSLLQRRRGGSMELRQKRGSMELRLQPEHAPPEAPPEPPDHLAPEQPVEVIQPQGSTALGSPRAEREGSGDGDVVLAELNVGGRRASILARRRSGNLTRLPSALSIETGECEICFDGVVEVAIRACGHRFCAECVRQVCCTNRDKTPRCAFCRRTIDGFIPIAGHKCGAT